MIQQVYHFKYIREKLIVKHISHSGDEQRNTEQGKQHEVKVLLKVSSVVVSILLKV